MNREEFLAFNDTVIEEVFIKEMNTELFVKNLTGAERAQWEMDPIAVNNDAKKGNTLQFTKSRIVSAKERLVELATCNKDGSRFFKDGDASAIGRRNARVISALYDVGARLSGITKEDLDELAKNSGDGPVEE